ncbi:MAG: patatin-like phospholipase family protein [Pseudomonadota bacterium]|nr:patatin-like phospholipase family protein [Pseudomonadota bacterium]
MPNYSLFSVSMINALLLMLISFSCMTWPGSSHADEISAHPKIGLALSGGGARGAAHIGVLRELERQNIRIDYIAGTSMGAVIGGLYASGLSVDQIEQVYLNIDWNDVLNDSPPRQDLSMRRKFDQAIFQLNKKLGVKDGKLELPAGVIRGQKLELELQKLLLHVAEINDFDQLVIPFRSIASDIATNQVVVIGSGSMSQALRASMAVPGLFTPVKVNNRLLVDGGITNNLPVDVVREMGADIVIAVDIGSPLLKMDASVSIITIAEQLTNILVRRTTDQQIEMMAKDDILIVPELGEYSAGNFADSASLISKGGEATQEKTSKLARLAPSAPVLAVQHETCPSCQSALPVIGYIRVENDSQIDNEFLQKMLHQKTGQPLDVAKLEQDIGRIYGLGTFDSVQYDLEKKGTETGLVLKVRKQPWGPNYLQFGLSLSSDFSQSNRFSIRFGYTKTPINKLNGEWRTIFSLGEEPGIQTDLYQPLAIGSPWFVEPTAFLLNNKYYTFDEDKIITETSVTRLGAALAIGRQFGSTGDVRLGLRRYVGQTEITIGDPDIPDQDIDAGELYIDARHDSLDDIFFPRQGWTGELGLLGSRTELGADDDFDQAMARAFSAKTWGRHTLHLGGRIMTTYNGEAPIQNYFRLGGMYNLPGYSENELSGQNAVLFKTGYLRTLTPFLSMPTFLGATLQYGDVFQNKDDIKFSDLKTAAAMYFGLHSVIGPLYIGYGIAEGGEYRVYFTIGGVR